MSRSLPATLPRGPDRRISVVRRWFTRSDRSQLVTITGAEMGFRYQRRLRLGRGQSLNLSKRGASVSKRAGRVTFNSRGGGSIRILPGLSFRFGRRR